MNSFVEQQICLKFYVSKRNSSARLLTMLQKAYDGSVLSKTEAYEWYRSFKVVNDLPHSGRSSMSTTNENIDKVKEMVLKNQHCSLRELARELS